MFTRQRIPIPDVMSLGEICAHLLNVIIILEIFKTSMYSNML